MGQLLLVRHGQASWGAADYDVLSEVGHEQSRLLGVALQARGIEPDLVVTGSMRRHRETWESMAFEGAPIAEVDSGWDEFDHLTMLARQPAPFEGVDPTPAQFQTWFEAATDRWIGGEFDRTTTRRSASSRSESRRRYGVQLRRRGGEPPLWSHREAQSPGRSLRCSMDPLPCGDHSIRCV